MTNRDFTQFVAIWPLCNEASQAIYTVTRRFVTPTIQETGMNVPRAMYSLLMARAVEPQPISVQRVWRRYPYATRSSWEQTLTSLAERQLLEVQSGADYQLTAGGRALVSRVLKEFHAGLAEIEKSIEPEYPATDVERLAAVLNRLIVACLNAPIEIATLKDSHGLIPNGSTLAQIDQALDDLNAFRDDAHLAAWQPLSISGQAWELFTFLWRGEVKNADEMTEKAAARGHSREAYQSALGDLIGRGWVRAASESVFEVTEVGRQIREEAEAATERNFYTPWQVLNDVEVVDLQQLLTRLKTVLAHTAEAVAA
jgi:hypothetical protein